MFNRTLSIYELILSLTKCPRVQGLADTHLVVTLRGVSSWKAGFLVTICEWKGIPTPSPPDGSPINSIHSLCYYHVCLLLFLPCVKRKIQSFIQQIALPNISFFIYGNIMENKLFSQMYCHLIIVNYKYCQVSIVTILQLIFLWTLFLLDWISLDHQVFWHFLVSQD